MPKKPMNKPASGGKPKKITAKAPPGGKQTPGAKAAARRNAQTTDSNNGG